MELGLILIRVLGPASILIFYAFFHGMPQAKKKDAWRLVQAVILFFAMYSMSSGPILAFF
jgi:hypothetical protein